MYADAARSSVNASSAACSDFVCTTLPDVSTVAHLPHIRHNWDRGSLVMHAPVPACPSGRRGTPGSQDLWTRETWPAGAHSTCLRGPMTSWNGEGVHEQVSRRRQTSSGPPAKRQRTPIGDDRLGRLELCCARQVRRDRFQLGRNGGSHDARVRGRCRGWTSSLRGGRLSKAPVGPRSVQTRGGYAR